MAYGYPISASSAVPVAVESRGKRSPEPTGTRDSLSYRDCRRSRPILIIAMTISASFHLALLFGIQRRETAPPPPVETEWIALVLPPQLKELEEEPEPSSGETDKPLDLSIPVPMQADLPALPRPDDFVQALDFSSLIERPDLSASKISVIPEHISRGLDLRQRIGTIFNLSDLDRPPEPVVQQAPIFPFALKRDGIEGNVRVEFVVDTNGRVLNPYVISSSNPGFEEAAVSGVARWRFRPGIKNGRKVNTRMQVPIVFRIIEGMD